MLAEAQRAMAAQSVPTDCKMIKPVDPQFSVEDAGTDA